MKKLIAPLGGLVLLAAADYASAASPAYCALYAREYALETVRKAASNNSADVVQRIQDQAFYKCLNLDEQPALPQSSAYAEEVGGSSKTAAAVAAFDTPADATAAPDNPPPAAEPAKVKVASASSGKHPGSGLKAWSPEWKAWCKKYFPNSFDEKTGYIQPYSGPRTLCR